MNSSDVSSIIGIGIGTIIFSLVLFVLFIICRVRIYQKLGLPGWNAIIPVYCDWQLFPLIGIDKRLSLLLLLTCIPVVGGIAAMAYGILSLIANYRLGRKFGMSSVACVFLMIIFNMIGYLILAFGSAEPEDTSYGKDEINIDTMFDDSGLNNK